MYSNIIKINTNPNSLHNITDKISFLLKNSKVDHGLCNLFVQHTSCSLIISENYDPYVLTDLQNYMNKLVPKDNTYLHSIEGPDDMPAHIKNVLTATNICIPIKNGNLNIGTWQAVYLWEHREQSHDRKVVVSIVS